MTVTVNYLRETGPVGEYLAQLTVTANDDTLQVPVKIRTAIFQPNRDDSASDTASVTFTPGEQTITFRLDNTTNVTGTLWITGEA